MPEEFGAHDSVFVCYSRKDLRQVDEVVAELSARGHHLWLDRTGIAGSDPWRRAIVDGMRECRAILFFGSASSYDSEYVATELTLATERKLPVIPVMLDDTPPHGEVAFLIARLHRLNLFEDGVDEIERALEWISKGPKSPPPERGSPLSEHGRGRRTLLGIAKTVTILVVLGLLIWGSNLVVERLEAPEASSEEITTPRETPPETPPPKKPPIIDPPPEDPPLPPGTPVKPSGQH